MCGRYILCDVEGTFYSDVFGTFTPDADTGTPVIKQIDFLCSRLLFSIILFIAAVV